MVLRVRGLLMHRLVTILANPECPHCVHATDTLAAWCEELGLPVAGLDIVHNPEVAQRWKVEQSPTLIMDRGDGKTAVFAGVPTHDEFVRWTRP